MNSSEDSTQQPPRKPSVVQFDHTEFMNNTNTKQCSELTVEELLKYVIAKAATEKNPVVASGCERILKQINREPTPFNRNRRGRGK